MEFIQEAPKLDQIFENDPLLPHWLKAEVGDQFHQELMNFSAHLLSQVDEWGWQAEQTPPQHVPYSPWGERIDYIKTHPAWKSLERLSALEGLVAIGYERKYKSFSRILQFAKIYLFHPSSAFFTCPLAMTDGAAKLFEVYGQGSLKEKVLRHLTSRDPEEFWTSGQWMTEQTGGSDVGASLTRAKYEDGTWRLYGTKWFTSATTSQMAMTLARIEDNDQVEQNSKGLALFYVELRDAQSRLQNIEIRRLKDKLGTKALPTAELELKGTPAILVGEPGRGIPTIATLFNITRIYNAITSIATSRRMIDLATQYARTRKAFGKMLIEHPLHQRTLFEAEVLQQCCFHLTFYLVKLLGIEECQEKESHTASKLLRLLTPVTKLVTAKHNMTIVSEMLEAIGGTAYVEDSRLSRYLRDSQVFPIWEGTTNILSLDLLRVMEKEKSYGLWSNTLRSLLKSCPTRLQDSADLIAQQLSSLDQFVQMLTQCSRQEQEYHARNIAFAIGHITSASLQMEYCGKSSESENSCKILESFCRLYIKNLEDNFIL